MKPAFRFNDYTPEQQIAFASMFWEHAPNHEGYDNIFQFVKDLKSENPYISQLIYKINETSK